MPEPAPEFVIRPAADADLDAIVDLLWAVAAEGRWIGEPKRHSAARPAGGVTPS